MRTAAFTTLALLGSGALMGAFYWAFLITPESTVWMLALSAALALATAAVGAIGVSVALLVWSGCAWGAGLRLACRRPASGVLPLLAVVGVWWLTLRGEAWAQAHSGEMGAWLIARFGWADARWMFSAVAWLGAWLRVVVAPFVALVWWREILDGIWLPTRHTVRRALAPVNLLAVTAVVATFAWGPWMSLVPWRPQGLPAGGAELAFVGAKLGVAALLAGLGSTLIVRAAATRRL